MGRIVRAEVSRAEMVLGRMDPEPLQVPGPLRPVQGSPNGNFTNGTIGSQWYHWLTNGTIGLPMVPIVPLGEPMVPLALPFVQMVLPMVPLVKP